MKKPAQVTDGEEAELGPFDPRACSGFQSSAECSPWSSLEAGGNLGGGRKKAEERMKVSDS